MHITFPTLAIIHVNAAITLQTAHRSTNKADSSISGLGVASVTGQALVLLNEKAVQNKWKTSKSIYSWIVQRNTTVQLGCSMGMTIVCTPSGERVLERILIWKVG